MKVNLFYAK